MKHHPENGNAILIVLVTMTLIMFLVSSLVDHLATTEAEAISEHLAKIRIYWAMRGRLDYALSRSKAPCTISPYATSTPYTIGQLVLGSGKLYQCTTAGTSGVAAPAWTTPTTTDGGVVWTAIDRGKIANINGYDLELNTAAVYPIQYPEYGGNYTIQINTTVFPFFDSTLANWQTIPPTGAAPAAGDLGQQNANLGTSYTETDGRISLIYSLGAVGTAPVLQDIANRMQSLRVDLCMGGLVNRAGTMGATCNPQTCGGTGDNLSTIERMTMIR